MQSLVDDECRAEALDALAGLFREFGDGCERPDAAYGWRPVGNAILRFGERGREVLERMRLQSEDRWLAWIAYQVVHVPQTSQKMQLVEESDAVGVHDRYAPQFPGWRSW